MAIGATFTIYWFYRWDEYHDCASDWLEVVTKSVHLNGTSVTFGHANFKPIVINAGVYPIYTLCRFYRIIRLHFAFEAPWTLHAFLYPALAHAYAQRLPNQWFAIN